ncbi:transketolase [Bradyrhizobium sp. CSA207]|uniref:alpha-ketoacid dehydrogenase subunit alpha/beta n=1 Tax=Bradyrhizobium sp. CSA207 TaxID=2698826 RepID=UPI0023AEE6F1|nr:alpha-ketoacid dehydrogenase subunit alpha/beta [Bradyrhizobium sp. CSA207]MDE5445794.1 transketolase [Bradyrhizobium sp. CSA207]
MNAPATKKSIIPSTEANFAREMLGRIAYIRAFETKAFSLTQVNPPRVMGSMHFCAGQEAVPLGAMAALGDDDQVICTYRGHGWAIASGLDARSVMGEICQRAEGVNGGRAGSAYLMAPDTRFIGENSIVGAGTTMACGVAMANLARKNGRVVVVTIGDGAMNQGAVHEAFAFAAARKLPVIFVVENNGWAELTPTSDMVKVERLAQRASGYGIPSGTIDGTDPIVVRDSFTLAAERARKGEGPSLLECRVPRLWGHYSRDIEHYRPKADRQAAADIDPITQLSKRLVESKIMNDAQIAELIAVQTARVEEMTESLMASALPDPATAQHHVVASLTTKAIPKVVETKELSYIDAVNAALRAELESDPTTLVYGEDVGKAGGIFGGSRYLQRDFGEDRVFDTPIAENAILGSAVGSALSGMKPIVEIMWADFVFVALDQLVNQAANIRYITGGKSHVPIVVRMQQGATPGSCAQHSQSIEGILAHVPGLKVALAATGADAYALIRAAAADPDPCVVIEARGLYQTKGPVDLTDGAETVGKAHLRREGKDIAIITWGTMVSHALTAAEVLAKEGIEASVLDLRWLNPLDEGALSQVVRAANGRILVVHEAVRTGGFGAEIIVRVLELVGDIMPIIARRLTTPDVRMPAAPELQAVLIPTARTIADAARAIADTR